MKKNRDYLDIPGTYVLDPAHSRKGYHMNMFFMSLNEAVNREQFRANPETYLDGHNITEAQRQAIMQRDWLGMLKLGGNIYYTFKLAIFDGRPIDGNRSKIENEEKINRG